jgi:dephospho-CoA kinase
MSESEAILRIEGQYIKYKKPLVDFQIRNSGSKDKLKEKISELAEKIKPDIYGFKY